MSTGREFEQVEWDARLEHDARHLIRAAVAEDLGTECDLTTMALVPLSVRGSVAVVARQPGVIAGMKLLRLVLDEMEIESDFVAKVSDGQTVAAGTILARIDAAARDLLTAERTLLNFLGRLAGIATSARRYVDAIAGTGTRLYDTRKTTPGWRRLEKYAVRCGGGHNHRTGLYDAILIKDNHLAVSAVQGHAWNPADAVRQSRTFLREWFSDEKRAQAVVVEVEVDTLEQLRIVLPAKPDIVLLDNMSVAQLRSAVEIRGEIAPGTELEASGGITLATIRDIANTGIERISSGALTHSAVSLDVALDWIS